MNKNLIKLILLVLFIVIIYRLYNLSNNKIENFSNQNNRPLGNLIRIIRVKHNTDDNSYDLIFNGRYVLEHIDIKTNVLNSNINYVAYYLDDNKKYNENFILDTDEIQHPNRPNRTHGNLIISKPKQQGNNVVTTSSIKIKVLDGKRFSISKFNIYGTRINVENNSNLLSSRINKKVNINKTEKSVDPNTNKNIYKLSLDSEYLVNGLEFNYSIENPNVNINQNKSFEFEVHYMSKGANNTTNNYRLNNSYFSDDFNLGSNGFNSVSYLDKQILTNTIFISLPKKIIINGEEHSIIQLSNFKALINNKESFRNIENNTKNSTNTRNNNNNIKHRDNFQSIDDYAPDELCPSLSGIENQMKLADTICERIEYNDKIKNERLKLERNKQYILKLKSQDEEIEQLEKIIKELQNKRNDRDAYNDALRLAQLQKQKQKATTIKELAKKRLDHKKQNQIHMELNLVNDPPFESTSS